MAAQMATTCLSPTFTAQEQPVRDYSAILLAGSARPDRTGSSDQDRLYPWDDLLALVAVIEAT